MKKQAQLQFIGYKVRSSQIEFGDSISNEYKIDFEPRGEINSKENVFSLFLKVILNDTNENLKIKIEVEGQFKFENSTDERVEDYLYLNAPAILFPYIRAYINTLSTLSGNRPIILPTLNLSGLRERLKNNTTVIDE